MSEQTLPNLDVSQLRRAIQEEYELVAREPDRGFHFHTGRYQASLVGYEESWLAGIPEPAVASFAGTGNPFRYRSLQPGERVVDVGSGSGMDSLVAARMVGPRGKVIGVDMTPAMLEKASAAARESGLTNVQFREGLAESLPVPDGWADVVISNGVLNLTPDKDDALREMFRVLRPGGRLQIGDILVEREVPEDAKADISLWTGWIAGALLEAELRDAVVIAGFVGFEITWKGDVYAGAPQESDAEEFGTLGINFHARKYVDEVEWAAELASLTCEIPSNGR